MINLARILKKIKHVKKDKVQKITRDLLIKAETPIKLTWSLFFVFAFVRFIEYFSFSSQYTDINFSNYVFGLRYDFLFAGLIGIVLILVFLSLPRRFHKSAFIATTVFIVIAALLTWSLSEYYIITLIPLDHSLLIYPVSDIFYIAASSASFSFNQTFKLLIIIFTALVLSWLFVRKINLAPTLSLFAFMPFLVFVVFFNNITPDIHKYNQNHDFYQRVNKTSYLAEQLTLNYKTRVHYSNYDIPQIAMEYHDLIDNHDFHDPKFPFMRINNDKDVIGKYFRFGNDKPNFVFLIIESLSRNFSGPDACWGSFTPFLDSLAKNSLYWSNFLVTSERTFNVLPSSFASLPYGDKGFMALIEEGRYPDFLSLNSFLSRAGYHNNFFYGGWANFDYKKVFLKETGIDFILDETGFGSEYKKIDSLEDGFTWGYPDHAVFLRSMEILDSFPYQPRMDIYLTLSTHDPFLPPSPEYWEKIFFKHLKKLNIPEKESSFYEQRKAQFSTILYTDDAIRQLFNDYKQRPGFENTIFFIFGDHHMPMHDFNQIEKYHVPLIIYSPMLEKSKIFPAISSAADITPTILSLMNENFDLETPQLVHWLGCPLDTSNTFQSKKFIPFMRINRNIDELLWGKYFLSEGRLFKIDKEMNLIPYSNKKTLFKMEKMLEYFKILNDYVCNSNTIYKPLIQNDYDKKN